MGRKRTFCHYLMSARIKPVAKAFYGECSYSAPKKGFQRSK
jgi:hypothetical protein